MRSTPFLRSFPNVTSETVPVRSLISCHLTVHCCRVISVLDGIYALGKAHMRSIPFLRSFPNVTSETVQVRSLVGCHLTVHCCRVISVLDGIYALGKAHMRSIPFLRSFPNVTSETVQVRSLVGCHLTVHCCRVISVLDGFYALGKADNYAIHPVSQKFFPKVAFETIPMFVWLTMATSVRVVSSDACPDCFSIPKIIHTLYIYNLWAWTGHLDPLLCSLSTHWRQCKLSPESDWVTDKLQALVYDSLPSTQIISDVCFTNNWPCCLRQLK